MNAKDAIQTVLTSTQQMVGWFLGDLADSDLLVRPVPAANHIAWQLGHLIVSERMLLDKQLPTAYPELPAGFVDQHSPATASAEPPKGFLTKDEYLGLFNKSREVTKGLAARLADADLDKPTQGNMAKFAPTLGSLFLLISDHTLMHAGQFTVVRRKLGKPILF